MLADGPSSIPNETAQWTSSDPQRLAVSADGVLRALAPGTAIVSASVGTVQAAITLSVHDGGVAEPSGAVISAASGAVTMSLASRLGLFRSP